MLSASLLPRPHVVAILSTVPMPTIISPVMKVTILTVRGSVTVARRISIVSILCVSDTRHQTQHSQR